MIRFRQISISNYVKLGNSSNLTTASTKMSSYAAA